MQTSSHQPVLYKEIIHALQPKPGGRYVDGTLGAGGHARGILEACAPDGRVLGLDLDPHALALARETLAPYEPRISLAQASYATMLDRMDEIGWRSVDGILLDLGASSMQFDNSARGFSFQHDGPLDMRFMPTSVPTAADLVNNLPEEELAGLIFRYGEEPRSRRIAKAIVNARPLFTTRALAAVIVAITSRRSAIHPATRTFQALRIAVNQELASLKVFLPLTLIALVPGGRLAIVSFHSLEDRLVKEFIHAQTVAQFNPPYQQIYNVEREATMIKITRKPITPSDAEIKKNPRARSAKLRVAEKLSA